MSSISGCPAKEVIKCSSLNHFMTDWELWRFFAILTNSKVLSDWSSPSSVVCRILCGFDLYPFHSSWIEHYTPPVVQLRMHLVIAAVLCLDYFDHLSNVCRNIIFVACQLPVIIKVNVYIVFYRQERAVFCLLCSISFLCLLMHVFTFLFVTPT